MEEVHGVSGNIPQSIKKCKKETHRFLYKRLLVSLYRNDGKVSSYENSCVYSTLILVSPKFSQNFDLETKNRQQ